MKTTSTMSKKTALTALLALLATTACHARSLTLNEANTIIIVLVIIVVVLLILGVCSLRYNRILARRNEQLNRILNALNDYRAVLADKVASQPEAGAAEKPEQRKKAAKEAAKDECQAFFVEMDARVNKEEPFADPDFNQQSLADFMGVDLETFCRLVPRYKDPDRALQYINSLRAEHAAKILMEQSDFSTDDIVKRCGFKDAMAFLGAFKFAYGITPMDYVHGINRMFK